MTARRRRPGVRISPGHLPEHVDVEFFVGQQALEPGVLLLQGLEPHHVLGTHGLELVAPALIGRDRDLEVATDLGHVGPFRQQSIGLSELAADLLGLVTPALHEVTSCPVGRL
jgi:hypothetical protein